jgi:guanylate kinase
MPSNRPISKRSVPALRRIPAVDLLTDGRRGLLLVISAPSGAGKTTVAHRLLDLHGGPKGRLERSVSVTTRPRRLGEVDGTDYFFVSEKRFADMAARGELLEQAELYGHQYGTPRSFVEDRLAQGVDVLLILDAEGHRQLAATHGADLVSVFLLPPSREELKRRLCGRARDDNDTIAGRLEAADEEIARAGEYQHVLVNHDLDHTVESVSNILEAERQRRSRPSLTIDLLSTHTRQG